MAFRGDRPGRPAVPRDHRFGRAAIVHLAALADVHGVDVGRGREKGADRCGRGVRRKSSTWAGLRFMAAAGASRRPNARAERTARRPAGRRDRAVGRLRNPAASRDHGAAGHRAQAPARCPGARHPGTSASRSSTAGWKSSSRSRRSEIATWSRRGRTCSKSRRSAVGRSVRRVWRFVWRPASCVRPTRTCGRPADRRLRHASLDHRRTFRSCPDRRGQFRSASGDRRGTAGRVSRDIRPLRASTLTGPTTGHRPASIIARERHEPATDA